jgi:hypothetical protein
MASPSEFSINKFWILTAGKLCAIELTDFREWRSTTDKHHDRLRHGHDFSGSYSFSGRLVFMMKYSERLILVILGVCVLSMLGSADVMLGQEQRAERPREAITPPTVGITQTSKPPTIKIWTDKGDDKSGNTPVYYVGERIYVSFQVDKDSYVTVYDIDSTGNVNILFPNPYHRDNLARGGRIYTLPTTNYGYDLVIKGPTGKEVLYALVSTHIYYHWQYGISTPPVWSDMWGAPCTWGHEGCTDQSIATRRFQKRLQSHEEANMADLTLATIRKQIELDSTVGCAQPKEDQEACQTSFYVTMSPY